MQRADQIVMAVLGLVVDRRTTLHDILQRRGIESLRCPRGAPDFFGESERGAPVAVRHANERSARLAIERQFFSLDRLGPRQ